MYTYKTSSQLGGDPVESQVASLDISVRGGVG